MDQNALRRETQPLGAPFLYQSKAELHRRHDAQSVKEFSAGPASGYLGTMEGASSRGFSVDG
jgi:hypothetical protein